MRNWMRVMCVFFVSLVFLGYGIGRSGLAAAFSDRVSGMRAQDETTYAASAAELATHGGWMTPQILGRYFLVKPPLFIWLAAVSMKILGISAFALRIPALLAGCLAITLLFYWPSETRSLWTACLTVVLLLADPLWHTFARLGYTDMLLVASMASALFAVARDPVASRGSTLVIAGVAIATGVMAKNLAGVLPIPILLAFYAVSRRSPPWANLMKICALAAMLAAPWHIYQLIAHRRWFWADYVQVQLLEYGMHPPAPSGSGGPAWFYLKRLIFTDPLLCLLAAIAAPSLIRSIRNGKTEAALLAAWLLVAAGAPLAFRYRNLPYLLPLIPPLCLAASRFGPLASRQGAKLTLTAAAMVFCVKVGFAGQTWGLQYSAAAPIPSEQSLRWYSGLRRPNELIAVNPDDEFYSMALPLPKVRYCYIDNTGIVMRYAPHYAYLGITVSAPQFEELEIWEPKFRERLRAWGLDSPKPVATAIVATSTAEVVQIVQTHPRSDFYVPKDLAADIADLAAATHRPFPAAPGRSFLLALDSAPTSVDREKARKW